jgi:hypothetical protein
MRCWLVLIANALLCHCLVGCVGYETIEQTISVKLLGEGDLPMSGILVRYHSKPDCNGRHVEGRTSETGEVQMVRSAKHGTIVVLLEKPSLCVERRGSWVAIWEPTLDPAAYEQIECIHAESPSPICKRSPRYGTGT